jgi:uridine kinase
MAARVVLLAGPSGSGKTSLTRRVGLPFLALDDFYRDVCEDADDDLPLPRRFGIVDWDDAASWDGAAAMAAIAALCRDGFADVPVYDIRTSRRVGQARVDLAGRRVFVAEGVFAAELVAPARDLGVLADALCLTLPAAVTFTRRLVRDLAELRKPPLTLLRRGVSLARAERGLVARWTALGCRPCSPAEAEAILRRLAVS